MTPIIKTYVKSLRSYGTLRKFYYRSHGKHTSTAGRPVAAPTSKIQETSGGAYCMRAPDSAGDAPAIRRHAIPPDLERRNDRARALGGGSLLFLLTKHFNSTVIGVALCHAPFAFGWVLAGHRGLLIRLSSLPLRFNIWLIFLTNIVQRNSLNPTVTFNILLTGNLH